MLKLFQVDAFTDRPFGGNPAAVMPLESWLPEATLQDIAMENNLSETAFFVPAGERRFHLRWFTPLAEVPLCGHATLASAHVILRQLHKDWDAVQFDTLSGVLGVRRAGDLLVMDFPARMPVPCSVPPGLVEGLGREPVEVLRADNDVNVYALYPGAADVLAIKPDFGRLKTFGSGGICVTAPGETCDFVSRYFAPAWGIDEDPVTGSTHCALVPLWSARLGKPRLLAHQLSRRVGVLHCEYRGERVAIAGQAVTVLEGRFLLL